MIESAYNSQKASYWGGDVSEIDKDPHPSVVSSVELSDQEDFGLGLYSDSQDS